MLDQDDWRCPTCLDLLFKPAVNSSCGHIYCFWCLHRAMSPYTPSSCPVCRAKYTHLPAICTKLHRFLACQFPIQYALRRAETEAEERDLGGAAPEPDDSCSLPPPAHPNYWQPLHFACDNPRCGRLLYRPVVLTCGHAVCGTSCLPRSSRSSGDAACECPACGMMTRPAPAVCKQLADLLRTLFPEESQQREQEQRQEQQWEADTVATGCDIDSSLQPIPQQEQQEVAQGGFEGEQEEPTTPHASASGHSAVAGEADAERPSDSGGAAAEQQHQQALSPSLAAALRQRAAAGGRSQELAERLEANLRHLTGEGYVHHGVGCDGCGLYPIQGRRYQCKECPDAMGFDLCGACMDRGVATIVGRFNQRHTPDHRMHLMRPRVTATHMLQAANPELPMEQLMWLLELTLTGGEEEEQDGQPAPHQLVPPPQQQLQQQHARHQGQIEQETGGPQSHGGSADQPNDAGDDPPIPMLRRGPRPAYVTIAQEPSPSAYAVDHQTPPAAVMASVQGSQAASGEGQGLILDEANVVQSDGDEEVHVPLESLIGDQRAPHDPE